MDKEREIKMLEEQLRIQRVEIKYLKTLVGDAEANVKELNSLRLMYDELNSKYANICGKYKNIRKILKSMYKGMYI